MVLAARANGVLGLWEVKVMGGGEGAIAGGTPNLWGAMARGYQALGGGVPWPGGTLLSTSLSTSSWSLTCRMRSCPQTRPCASSTFSCSRQSSMLRRSCSSRTVSRCWGRGTTPHGCHRVPCSHPMLCEMETSLARWGRLGGSYLNMVLEITVVLEEGLAVVFALVCRDVGGSQGMGTLGDRDGQARGAALTHCRWFSHWGA